MIDTLTDHNVRKQRRAEIDGTVLVLFGVLVIYLELEFLASTMLRGSKSMPNITGGADFNVMPLRHSGTTALANIDIPQVCIQGRVSWLP